MGWGDTFNDVVAVTDSISGNRYRFFCKNFTGVKLTFCFKIDIFKKAEKKNFF